MKGFITENTAPPEEEGPFEIERKFLIEYPDISWLESLETCCKVDIIQTYLLSSEGEVVRVRRWEEGGSCAYYETRKRTITGVRRVEHERPLTRREYLDRLREADPTLRPVRKTRYRLTWERQCFEIDVYPFWQDRAIVEIELTREDQPIRFPRELKVIREVTEDEDYKNHSLARLLPAE